MNLKRPWKTLTLGLLRFVLELFMVCFLPVFLLWLLISKYLWRPLMRSKAFSLLPPLFILKVAWKQKSENFSSNDWFCKYLHMRYCMNAICWCKYKLVFLPLKFRHFWENFLALLNSILLGEDILFLIIFLKVKIISREKESLILAQVGNWGRLKDFQTINPPFLGFLISPEG